MTKIMIMSRKEAENIDLDRISCAIISINNNNSKTPNIRRQQIKGLITLFFDDVERDENKYFSISKDQAVQIVNFVNKFWNNVELMIIHCEAGISRSSGVAAAILKYKTRDDNFIFGNKSYVPNMKCYRMVLDEFYKIKNDKK
jgi:predicted protein tyrosine phosphatase